MTQTAEPVQAGSSFHSLWKLLSCAENPRIQSLRFCTSIDKDVNNQSSAAVNRFKMLWGHWHAFSHLWLFHLFRWMLLLNHLSIQTPTTVWNNCWCSAKGEIQILGSNKHRGQIPYTREAAYIYKYFTKYLFIFKHWTKSMIQI